MVDLDFRYFREINTRTKARMDYANRQTSLTADQARLSDDEGLYEKMKRLGME
jgi:hypothetical protein